MTSICFSFDSEITNHLYLWIGGCKSAYSQFANHTSCIICAVSNSKWYQPQAFVALVLWTSHWKSVLHCMSAGLGLFLHIYILHRLLFGFFRTILDLAFAYLCQGNPCPQLQSPALNNLRSGRKKMAEKWLHLWHSNNFPHVSMVFAKAIRENC